MTELTNTSRLLLGMLHLMGEKTGYEIKAMVDDSTEFFWPASYGRIYPELRRLEEEGLVRGRDEPQGGRPRKLYALTDAGREAFERWLASSSELSFELRDEGLLKFFFADALPLNKAIETLESMRLRHERMAARLRELEPFVRETELRFPLLTLESGIAMHAFYAERCAQLARELGESPERP